MKAGWRSALCGAVGGAVNGLFGGGGGMPVVLLYTRWCGMKEKTAFATCVATILPFCAVSAGLYLWQGELSPAEALPYLLGGLCGGFLGGRLFGKVPTLWLRRLFALFVLYGGVKYLL